MNAWLLVNWQQKQYLDGGPSLNRCCQMFLLVQRWHSLCYPAMATRSQNSKNDNKTSVFMRQHCQEKKWQWNNWTSSSKNETVTTYRPSGCSSIQMAKFCCVASNPHIDLHKTNKKSRLKYNHSHNYILYEPIKTWEVTHRKQAERIQRKIECFELTTTNDMKHFPYHNNDI